MRKLSQLAITLAASTIFITSLGTPAQVQAAEAPTAQVQAAQVQASQLHAAQVQSAPVRARMVDPVHAKSPIHHLFVIVQENHSFDNYFGTYTHAPGFLPLPGTPAVDTLPPDAFSYDLAGHKVAPFTFASNQVQTPDLTHAYQDMQTAVDGGKMDQYAAVYNREYPTAPVALSMGNYDYHTVGPYWDYAQHFALADNWFTPIFGPTTPNTLYLIAGRAGVAGSTLSYTRYPGESLFQFANIGDEMSAAHVGWKWYQGGWALTGHKSMDNPFLFFDNYAHGKYKNNLCDLQQFPSALRAHKLPDVVFMKASANEHPGSNITSGVNDTVALINAIMRSKYWHDSAIVLTYDESGGFYDHVAPPNLSALNADGLLGDGPRVPTLVISPFAKQNYVSHVQYDSTSILKFIEWNWNLPALTTRDAVAANLLDFFDFNSPSAPFLLDVPADPTADPTSAPSGARTLPRNHSMVVYFNNFRYGSTGAPAPYQVKTMTYLAISDLARNLNARVVEHGKSIELAWQGRRYDFTTGSRIVLASGKRVDLGTPPVHQRGYWFVPLNRLLPAMGLQMKQLGPQEVQILV